MSKIPHGEPYAGKLHVRFDEGAGVPCGGVSPYSTPSDPPLTAGGHKCYNYRTWTEEAGAFEFGCIKKTRNKRDGNLCW